MGGKSRDEEVLRSFIVVLIWVSFILTWLVIPIHVIESTWKTEQKIMETWVGKDTNQWVLLNTEAMLSNVVGAFSKMAENINRYHPDDWLTKRIYASIFWMKIAIYRGYAFIMWFMLGLPLIMAASIDAYYKREIRKFTFVSQSPIMHKMGITIFKITGIVVVIWLFIPIQMPVIIGPITICMLALSLWVWTMNLQKRL